MEPGPEPSTGAAVSDLVGRRLVRARYVGLTSDDYYVHGADFDKVDYGVELDLDHERTVGLIWRAAAPYALAVTGRLIPAEVTSATVWDVSDEERWAERIGR